MKEIIAIIALAAIEITALIKEVDGAMLVPIVAGITALGTYVVVKNKLKKEN